MSGERVDVLGVLDDAASLMRKIHGMPKAAASIDEARTAVAELIEADKEYDDARGAWEAGAPYSIGETDSRPPDHPALVRLTAAAIRRRAALSRIQPDGQGE